MDLQRKLLEELMNPLLGTEKNFRDRDVCKHMLVAFCPHDLFPNYQNSPDKGRLGYEEDLAQFLNKLVVDMDKTIKRGKDRLDFTDPGEKEIVEEEEGEKQEKIVQVEEQIKVRNSSTDARMDAHMIGKQHTGYSKIREWLNNWK
ncbi:hypothetical protein HK405_009439, partial [Cladochytrium tenue]